MRISDWSSDVCSSDLQRVVACQPGDPVLAVGPGNFVVADRAGQHVVAGGGAGEHPREGLPCRSREGDPATLGEARKIGRASCGERVWQVRVDLGGRSIIKKKTKKQKTEDIQRW